MKKTITQSPIWGDGLWVIILFAFCIPLLFTPSRLAFEGFTGNHPYISGFIKFALLATMGELLGLRLAKGHWSCPVALLIRFLVWGLVGFAVPLVFAISTAGVLGAQSKGMLPGMGSGFLSALFASTFMNLTFGPMLFASHKMSDLSLDLVFGEKSFPCLKTVIERMDWQTLVRTMWLKYCIFFWIPAHTFVFMLPPAYRVISSAFLSIALGVIASISKKASAIK